MKSSEERATAAEVELNKKLPMAGQSPESIKREQRDNVISWTLFTLGMLFGAFVTHLGRWCFQ